MVPPFLPPLGTLTDERASNTQPHVSVGAADLESVLGYWTDTISAQLVCSTSACGRWKFGERMYIFEVNAA